MESLRTSKAVPKFFASPRFTSPLSSLSLFLPLSVYSPFPSFFFLLSSQVGERERENPPHESGPLFPSPLPLCALRRPEEQSVERRERTERKKKERKKKNEERKMSERLREKRKKGKREKKRDVDRERERTHACVTLVSLRRASRLAEGKWPRTFFTNCSVCFWESSRIAEEGILKKRTTSFRCREEKRGEERAYSTTWFLEGWDCTRSSAISRAFSSASSASLLS